MLKSLKCILQQGHQVASGLSCTSPYPAGTIAMQTPFFKERGLDLSDYYQGMLNLSIAPLQFEILLADYTLIEVNWAEGFAAEIFSFLSCSIETSSIDSSGSINFSHPATKKRHFQSNSMIEILAPKINNLNYGAKLVLKYDKQKLRTF